MSGSQPGLHPQPPVFGDADYRDNDAYGLDCRAANAARNDIITAAALVGVFRIDGAQLQDGDLAVTAVGVVTAGVTVALPGGPFVATTGNFLAWRAQGGLAGSSYGVTLALTYASGPVINRTVIINTPPYVG